LARGYLERRAAPTFQAAPEFFLRELIEVRTGSYLGEDDIVRIEDDYHCS